MNNLDPAYLLDNERYIQCSFLDVSSFVRFCDERGVRTSRKQLERFEKLGLFYPIVRVEYPRIREKIEYVDEGRGYNIIGILEADDAWSGDTREGYGYFEFSKDFVEPFRKEGLLWVPWERGFSPWDDFTDEDGYTRVESFYSAFQILDLRHIIKRLALELRLEWADTWDPDVLKKFLVGHDAVLAGLRDNWTIGRDVAFVCQAISDRYFPHTQSDGRSIRISHRTCHHDWDWDEYRRRWDASQEIERIGMSAQRIKGLAEYVARTASHVDPLERWYGLVTFISVGKREKLKKEALLAQNLYAAEKMLRLFYKDVTGEELPPPDETASWKKDFYYGKGVTSNPQLYLEFLANEYHLNPRPRLILLVEGDGEERVFGRLCERLFGISFATLGIEVHNLQGIGNFGANLRTFIDDHHRRQTLVFLVSDNEGNVTNAMKKLLKANSRYVKGKKVTKDDYVYTWQKCIELDNFGDDKIAIALSDQSRGHHFTCDEVTVAREADSGHAILQRLFREKTGRDLDKPGLLEALCERMVVEANESGGIGELPPIGNLLQRIIKLASMNHPPHNQEIWEHNQQSGYFGDVPNRPKGKETDDKFMSAG